MPLTVKTYNADNMLIDMKFHSKTPLNSLRPKHVYLKITAIKNFTINNLISKLMCCFILFEKRVKKILSY